MTEMQTLKTKLEEAYLETLDIVRSVDDPMELKKLGELHQQLMAVHELETKSFNQYEELRLKEEEITNGKKDRVVKIVLEGATLLVPAMFSSYWMAKGMTFEEKGSFTSRTAQWVSQHFRLFRK